MSPAPTITAVVTFWNRERYLTEAVESVLAQRHDVELVLVDDGSTDGSTDIARRYVPPARLIEQANRGSVGAANTGVAHATGDYVAFCDSDDLWTSSRLDVQLAAVAGDPLLDLVFGHADEFLSPELDAVSVRTRAPRGVIPAKIPSAALIRRDLFERVGVFDEALRSGAWLSWYAHARESGARECMLPDVVLRRRIHEHNNFATQEGAALNYLKALRPLVQQHHRAS
jgi:glycosyltransferase involved in cell wall biosynthesis